jgi:hypothetical protein
MLDMAIVFDAEVKCHSLHKSQTEIGEPVLREVGLLSPSSVLPTFSLNGKS